MARITLDTLQQRVYRYFQKRADKYSLQSSSLEVRYIFNWGGFVNATFAVTDGQRSYHLKLADDEGSQESLAKWRWLHAYLTAHYRAPVMLDWVSIPRTDFEGPMFEFINGQGAALDRQPEVLAGVLDLIGRLHRDRGLAETLASYVGDEEPSEAAAPDMAGDDGLPTCAQAFLDDFVDRYDGDLLGIAGNLPPFVPLKRLDWMMGEAREMEALARETPAFQQPARWPIHGDLNANNILVTPDGSWHVIDWDDLTLGDPAMDYANLLGPLADHYGGPEGLECLLPENSEDETLRERFRICLRAHYLDMVIDSLADWVEADFAPQIQEKVRADKERAHNAGLERYLKYYS